MLKEEKAPKVTLTVLRLIHKLASHATPSLCKSSKDLDSLIEILMLKLSDHKIVIKHSVHKIFHCILTNTGADATLKIMQNVIVDKIF